MTRLSITRQRKVEETPNLAVRLSVPRLTFRTSSKVKGEGHQAAKYRDRKSKIGKARKSPFADLVNCNFFTWGDLLTRFTSGKDTYNIDKKYSTEFDVKGLTQLAMTSPNKVLSPVTCHLCNLSIQTGIVPSSLKHARVRPLLNHATIQTLAVHIDQSPICHTFQSLSSVLLSSVSEPMCLTILCSQSNSQLIVLSLYRNPHTRCP